MTITKSTKPWLIAALVAILAGGGYYAWQKFLRSDPLEGIARGNGRVEAIEIDVSTKAPGRVKEILVNEGDFVTAGQVLARMDTEQLEAQRRQAEAQEKSERALHAPASSGCSGLPSILIGRPS